MIRLYKDVGGLKNLSTPLYKMIIFNFWLDEASEMSNSSAVGELLVAVKTSVG